MVIVLLRPEENMRGKKNTNGCANQVDEEHNRRASMMVINRFKMIVPVRLSHDASGIGHRSIPSLGLVCLVFSAPAEIKAWYTNINIIVGEES